MATLNAMRLPFCLIIRKYGKRTEERLGYHMRTSTGVEGDMIHTVRRAKLV